MVEALTSFISRDVVDDANACSAKKPYKFNSKEDQILCGSFCILNEESIHIERQILGQASRTKN